jgi:hypothetical protein
MTQFAVVEFVSRVAGRVGAAGNLAGQLLDRRPIEEVEAIAYDHLEAAFPFVEPSPDFVAALYRQLVEAPIVGTADDILTVGPDRRVVVGVAVGSLASAALVAAILWRYRAGHRLAA